MKIEYLTIKENIEVGKGDALIIVDMQYDFLPGGALAVEEGDQIISGINRVENIFYESKAMSLLTQDWHPKGHHSFASVYPDKKPGDEYSSEDGAIGPVLWPDHCVQGSKGAEFHEDLQTDRAYAIIRKGYHSTVDSYSGFLENDQKTKTGLDGYLKSNDIKRVFICGLALDYCVAFTAMDAADFGFEPFVIVDLSKGIDQPEDNISNMLSSMKKKGVSFAKEQSF